MKRYGSTLPILIIAILIGFVFQSCLDHTGPKTEVPDPQYSHTQNPGTSANDFLADTSFKHLVVEVDYMPGYEPKTEAIDSLEAFFEQRLYKNSITIKEPTEIESRNQDSYSADDVRNIESEERSTFSQGDTLAAYFMIVDGKYSERELMGIAYFNTSNAFFGPAYDEASSGVGSISRERVEAISFRHEFGHLFGLVDIPNSGTEMQEPHRDQEHGNHCDNDQCLMYYATQTTDLIGNTVGDEGITPLDDNCIADLQGNGGK
ncbi:M12 family metallo-peptidase [Fodinibius sp. N2]|uniref:M12 family metallo-peptidase n=1 Tax=Fodinibius alkaliphilus TaxID=3140241 RepID=UPI003159DA09